MNSEQRVSMSPIWSLRHVEKEPDKTSVLCRLRTLTRQPLVISASGVSRHPQSIQTSGGKNGNGHDPNTDKATAPPGANRRLAQMVTSGGCCSWVAMASGEASRFSRAGLRDATRRVRFGVEAGGIE